MTGEASRPLKGCQQLRFRRTPGGLGQSSIPALNAADRRYAVLQDGALSSQGIGVGEERRWAAGGCRRPHVRDPCCLGEGCSFVSVHACTCASCPGAAALLPPGGVTRCTPNRQAAGSGAHLSGHFYLRDSRARCHPVCPHPCPRHPCPAAGLKPCARTSCSSWSVVTLLFPGPSGLLIINCWCINCSGPCAFFLWLQEVLPTCSPSGTEQQ